MLTTSEKLKYKINIDEFIDPTIQQEMFNMDFNELFEYKRPSTHMLSIYYNHSLEEEYQYANNVKSKIVEQNFFSMCMYCLNYFFTSFSLEFCHICL